MHHSEVSVKCHESEEQDGAVEANEVGAADYLTQGQPENPLRLMVGRPEGETGGKEKVGEHQIQEKDVCYCGQLLILVDNQQDKSIAQVTQEEVDIVENWDEPGAKLVDIGLGAELDVIINHISHVGRVAGFIKKVQEAQILVFTVHVGVVLQHRNRLVQLPHLQKYSRGFR